MEKGLKTWTGKKALLKRKAKSLTAKFVAAAVIASGVVPAGFTGLTAEAAETNPKATLTVNMDPSANTGDIIHGAAGFLYGLTRGCSLEKCARIGSILSGNVIQVIGTTMPRERWNEIKLNIESKIKLYAKNM